MASNNYTTEGQAINSNQVDWTDSLSVEGTVKTVRNDHAREVEGEPRKFKGPLLLQELGRIPRGAIQSVITREKSLNITFFPGVWWS